MAKEKNYSKQNNKAIEISKNAVKSLKNHKVHKKRKRMKASRGLERGLELLWKNME